MSASSFILIVISALMHAGWNFFIKKSTADKVAVLWLGWSIAGVIMLPFSILLTDFTMISLKWIPYLIATSVAHALYIYLLGWSYSIGEISLMYPIARGMGILITIFIVWLFNIDVFSNQGLWGIFILVLGIVLISMKKFGDLDKRPAIIVAISVGGCISLYSIIDKLSIMHIPPFFYISVMFIGSPFLMIPIMFTKFKKEIADVWKFNRYHSGFIGIITLVTYLLILFALKEAPAPYVVALREISIVFGSILGIYFLKEEKNKRKIFGIFLIIIGALVIKMA